jgi:hypothetical protein
LGTRLVDEGGQLFVRLDAILLHVAHHLHIQSLKPVSHIRNRWNRSAKHSTVGTGQPDTQLLKPISQTFNRSNQATIESLVHIQPLKPASQTFNR